jgi:hypothetical protein
VASSTTSVFTIPPAGDQSTEQPARTLDRIVEHSTEIAGVWSDDVKPGDWIVVRTKNSTYSLASQGDGVFRVAGGWFATAHAEDRPVRIAGCTWGGAVIHTRLLAAVGMFLEFDNGVRTTRIREAQLIRGAAGKEH